MRLIVLLLVLLSPSVFAKDIKIAFGSCLKQWQPQPVWQGILSTQADAFIFAGDNVYTDVGFYRLKSEPQRIGDAYQELAESAEFQQFKKQMPQLFATWDDHDYGQNDAGADYQYKEASKQYFLDFFQIPKNAPETTRPGVYSVKYIEQADKRVQIILLDTRTFRSPLVKGNTSAHCTNKHWGKNTDPQATMLGDAQWHWLEKQLQKPADFRILVSSIQVIPEEHCWEKWANFPVERERLFKLISKTQVHNLVLVSGDRHLGEISKLPSASPQPEIYEITASGLNSAMTREAAKHEPNRFRVIEENVRQDHFGLITLQTDQVVLELKDIKGKTLRKAAFSIQKNLQNNAALTR